MLVNLLEIFKEQPPNPVLGFFQIASDAGYLQKTESGGYLIASPPEVVNKKKLKSHVEKVINILDGSWIELFVLSLILKSGQYLDAHWSVEPKGKRDESNSDNFGETDLLFINKAQGNLVILSCKTEIQKPLEHIESLHERSRNLGGSFSKAMLYVLHANEHQQQQLLHYGKLLGVQTIVGNKIFEAFGLDEKPYLTPFTG